MNIYGADLMRAVQGLPLGAVSLAAGLVLTLPAAAASAAEREHIANLLRSRGDTIPTPAQEALLAAWRVARTPGGTCQSAQKCEGWQTICSLGLEVEARAALAFYVEVIRANTRRLERMLGE